MAKIDKKTLIVIFRGYLNRDDIFGSENINGEIPISFTSYAKSIIPNSESFEPIIDFSVFSLEDASESAANIVRQIDDKCATFCPDTIIFIAYSAGALFARSVFAQAWGARPDATVDLADARDWAGKVERVVVLGGILKGWSISTATPAWTRFFAPLLRTVVRVGGWLKDRSRTPLILQLHRGEPFVVQTRLQHIAVENALRDSPDKRNLPLHINILGTQDQFISPSDCIEPAPPPNTVFIEVPDSNHTGIIIVEPRQGETVNRVTLSIRRAVLKRALTQSISEIRGEPRIAIKNDDINDYLDELDRPSNEQNIHSLLKTHEAIIILHGIRDEGFWTKRIAKEIKEFPERKRNGEVISIRAPTPSYGFFSMWDFIRPRERRRQTCWFLDQYADIKSCFPTALISVIGHSNGTYLAKLAMELCPAVKFERMILAGSVIRTDQDWNKLEGQIGERVLNLTATNDNVVALLPGAFERLKLHFLDVGGAGYHGFKAANRAKNQDQSETKLWEIGPLGGGHKAAISEACWSGLAEFAATGKRPAFETLSERCKFQIALEKIWPGLAIAILILFFYFIYSILYHFSAALALIIIMFISFFIWRFIRFW